MTVDKAGFAERVFEFAFNAEYCIQNKAVLAACPYLPTQQQEKRLGYDVKFEIERRGGGVSSIFLQHKVSRFVSSRTGSNAHFYDAAGGPYFAFILDNEQYNLIHHAASTKREAFYYCAPAFTTRKDMDDKFFAQTVVNDSIWIDVAGAGAIRANDSTSHNIVYSGDGAHVWRFSDRPERAKAVTPIVGREQASRLESFDVKSVTKIYESLTEDLREWWPTRQRGRRQVAAAEWRGMPDSLPARRRIRTLDQGIDAVRHLAVEYFGVSWLVGVQK